MQTKTSTFTFAIPKGHPEAGEKQEKEFDFLLAESEKDARQIMTDRKWSLVDLVNNTVRAIARSNAYQAALLPYKGATVSLDDLSERMVRDQIRAGLSEEDAREFVTKIMAKASKSPSKAKH